MKRDTTKTVGCDLGDRFSHICVLDDQGRVEARARLATSRSGFQKWFSAEKPCRVVIEVGTHSRWVSKLLKELGHEVIVANARQVRLIHQSKRKNDKLDAERLARLARADTKLLSPVKHRSDRAHTDLAVLRNRDQLVKARTHIINHIRGVAKAFGVRIIKCESSSFAKRAQQADIPATLMTTLHPMLAVLTSLNEQIQNYDSMLHEMAQRSADVQPLLTIHGVGELTAMAFILTLEDASRFQKSRDVGAYLGLVPGQAQSGQKDPQLRISKAGDPFVRMLLVNCAQRILGPFGQDSELKRLGQRLMQRGGKNAKKKAVIAVARKLAIVMHRLWRTGEVYEPLRTALQPGAAA